MTTTGPSVTLEQVNAAIVGETYTVLPDGKTTVCQLTLKNNFTVLGTSACVSALNFDAEKGNKYAREKALDRVWEVLGAILAEDLHRQSFVPQPCLEQPPKDAYPQVVLGDQVLYYERVGEQESEAMVAIVTSVLGADHFALVVYSPAGTSHPRANVVLLADGEEPPVGIPHYARRK